MKNLGIIVVLLGVLALIIPAFADFQSNLTLGIGAIIMLLGAFLHVFMLKRDIDKNGNVAKNGWWHS